jgi:hypothetical protein
VSIPSCNFGQFTISVPSFDESFTGTLDIDVAQLTQGFEIELCSLFPTLTTQQLCISGGGPYSYPGGSFSFPSYCQTISSIIPCSLLKINTAALTG